MSGNSVTLFITYFYTFVISNEQRLRQFLRKVTFDSLKLVIMRFS